MFPRQLSISLISVELPLRLLYNKSCKESGADANELGGRLLSLLADVTVKIGALLPLDDELIFISLNSVIPIIKLPPHNCQSLWRFGE